jgi:hypothetical protein
MLIKIYSIYYIIRIVFVMVQLPVAPMPSFVLPVLLLFAFYALRPLTFPWGLVPVLPVLVVPVLVVPVPAPVLAPVLAPLVLAPLVLAPVVPAPVVPAPVLVPWPGWALYQKMYLDLPYDVLVCLIFGAFGWFQLPLRHAYLGRVLVGFVL